MKFIGITGGIGAGKSEVLSILEKQPGCRVIRADEVAHLLMEPGTDCYNRIKEAFPDADIYAEDGHFDRPRLAKLLFADPANQETINGIVHPAVREYVLSAVRAAREEGELKFFFLEAALLIEEHYDKLCDELWYVYADQRTRVERLMASRGYSEEKCLSIMKQQQSEETFRSYCKEIIDNSNRPENTKKQILNLLKNKGEVKMSNVFGLDIGTRNVVGTVGYKNEDGDFIVVAQYNKEHETRAMLDGQIHDIGRVGRTVAKVKEELENQTGEKLTDVCIAAAGRVLKTITTHIEYEYPEESLVTDEDIHTLDLLGVEKAQDILKASNDTKYKFYCVGYSVVKYYLNDEVFISLEAHKADKIGEDIIATFLPEDVVDGLYSAVGIADLSVANMTLEPIAAINVAIPENFRLLNIALVDVGAGTSDISITRDGSIIAYGMIPHAGDELTEAIVQHFLVDFNTAETIKLASTSGEEVEYKDIMSIPHKIPAKDVWDLVEPTVDKMTSEIAAKIKELNGDKTVSACFVVGGGGKIHGFTDYLAKYLEIPAERVALRGEEVLGDVIFEQEDIKKDPLLVTPIGICLNYYDQKNNFIMVRFNGERVKLYDNNHLTVVDAALAAGFPNESLFPKRGTPINFTVNGAKRIARGEAGDSAVVTLNGDPANINTPLEPNCEITIEPSTSGSDAVYKVGQLEEFRNSAMTFIVNGKAITCPKCVEVNGILESENYEIKEGDVIETRGYYTVAQIAEFMDVVIDQDHEILVNNKAATPESLVYENFSLDCVIDGNPVLSGESYSASGEASSAEREQAPEESNEAASENEESDGSAAGYTPSDEPVSEEKQRAYEKRMEDLEKKRNEKKEKEAEAAKPEETAKPAGIEMTVMINRQPVVLSGKDTYVFVDLFDFYEFDLHASNGRAIVTTVNGHEAQYSEKLSAGDMIEIYWKEN